MTIPEIRRRFANYDGHLDYLAWLEHELCNSQTALSHAHETIQSPMKSDAGFSVANIVET